MDSKLQKWISAQIVGDGMLWKGAFGHQVGFVRDVLVYLVASGLNADDDEEWDRVKQIPDVISTHRSKSITLPVYDLSRPDLGLRLVLRNNFYNWKLSVLSERPVVADFSGLFHTTPPVEPDYTGNPLSPVYFEGVPASLVFGYYDPSDKMRWSAEIHSDHDLYAAIFLIMRALGAVKPFEWNTRAGHALKLDAQREKNAKRKCAK